MKNKKVLVIAHRGASAYAPENTLAAFKLAIRQKADAIELDVRKKGKLVVVHDLNKKPASYLVDVLDLAKKNKIPLILDVKESGIEKDILVEIKKRKMFDQIIIENMKRDNSVDKFKVAFGYVFSKRWINSIEEAIREKANYILPRASLFLTKRFIQKAHKNGLKVFVWTINSPSAARRLVKLGVDGIITNKPDVIRKYILQYKKA